MALCRIDAFSLAVNMSLSVDEFISAKGKTKVDTIRFMQMYGLFSESTPKRSVTKNLRCGARMKCTVQKTHLLNLGNVPKEYAEHGNHFELLAEYLHILTVEEVCMPN